MTTEDKAVLPNCSIAQALDIVGERWSLLIIRDAFAGMRRFSQFQRKLGVAKNILTKRLNRLVDEGILEKRTIEYGAQQEYFLTPKGIDLHTVALSLMHWGDKYAPNPKGIRLYYVDKENDRPIRQMSIMSEDGKPLLPHQVKVVPGPGFTE